MDGHITGNVLPDLLHGLQHGRRLGKAVAGLPVKLATLRAHAADQTVAHVLGCELRGGNGLLALDAGVDVLPDVLKAGRAGDRKSTRLNSSHVRISYAVF